MHPPWSGAGPTELLTEAALRWRVLAAGEIGAGLTALIALAGPHAGHGDATVAALSGASVLFGALMLRFWRRLPDWAITAAIVLSVPMLTVGELATADPTAPAAVMSGWVTVWACFLLAPRVALAIVVALSAAYGGVLAVEATPQTDEWARWVMTTGTVVVMGTIAGALRAYAGDLARRAVDVALRDGLTGLPNRRAFDDALDAAFGRGVQDDQPLSVLVADLDGLRHINAEGGRDAGDRALRAFAAIACDGTRRSDVIARIAGDALAILLPQTDEQGALLTAERLRHALSADHGLSVSVGIATAPKHADAADRLLAAAERALGAAKRLGRDRSVIFSEEVLRSLEALDETQPQSADHLAAVLVIAETIDVRDAGTALHSHTVGRYAEMIARQLGLDAQRVERIGIAGLLHDIGKIAVPDSVLRKPGRLTDSEMALVRRHAEIGAHIVASANLHDIASWIIAHHERPDGRGYPFGLSGEAIPLEARILAVADAFEAMTAERVYSAAQSEEAAMAELHALSGLQFDGLVVAAFEAARNAATGVPVAVAA